MGPPNPAPARGRPAPPSPVRGNTLAVRDQVSAYRGVRVMIAPEQQSVTSVNPREPPRQRLYGLLIWSGVALAAIAAGIFIPSLLFESWDWWFSPAVGIVAMGIGAFFGPHRPILLFLVLGIISVLFEGKHPWIEGSLFLFCSVLVYCGSMIYYFLWGYKYTQQKPQENQQSTTPRDG